MHAYRQDFRNKTELCVCGQPRESQQHPHPFTPARLDVVMCRCGSRDPDAEFHRRVIW